MSQSLSKPLIIVGSLAIILGGVFIAYMTESKQELEQRVKQSHPLPSPNPESSDTPTTNANRTIGDLWELKKEDNVEFDVQRIHDALAQIRLDENNRIVFNTQVLGSLREALEYSDLDWTEARLNEFIDIVSKGLPGETGEQAATVIRNFYDYLQAKEQTLKLQPEDQSMEAQRKLYDELSSLRELYLGPEVAAALYAEEDAITEYFFTTIALAEDPALSMEEKLRKQAIASDTLQNRKPNITNWDARYQSFAQEKQAILNAAISPTEKQKQINQLIQQHFNAQEQAQAEHLNLNGM